MDEIARYFEKAYIIFSLLKEGNSVSIDTIISEMQSSKTTVLKAINEYNLFDNTILFLENGCVRFSEKKDTFIDCKTYRVYSLLIDMFFEEPEHYLWGNEAEISQELGIDRAILQKVKTIVKMKIKTLQEEGASE